MATTKPGERKLQILQALAAMLGQPGNERITTAALAGNLGISEAALYRHFASKAQMFEGLIEFIETTIFSLINTIEEQQESGLQQTQEISLMLLHFAERNPGLTRVLIGDALINENERLQSQINQIIDRIELSLRQSLRIALSQGYEIQEDISVHANMIVSYIIGRCHRFAKSGFKDLPTQNAQAQTMLMLMARV